jgi:decaprenylphospho-beta-D-erythro-pentofuranosid-2-ulose 2-reductase
MSAGARRVLLIGGTSEIGLAIVTRLAAAGPVAPYLLGRDPDALTLALEHLAAAGCAEGQSAIVEAADIEAHPAVIAEAFASHGGFDVVVLAVGVLGGQEGLDADRDRTIEIMRTNFLGAGSLLIEAMRALRSSGGGRLVVLSSVAAERPRASLAAYGASKAGLDALAQGLADADAGSGVRVIVVRPGFVKTKMTAGLPSPPFATTPEAVAQATVGALGGSAHTIWVPSGLRFVFAVLRHLPRPLFRRLPV